MQSATVDFLNHGVLPFVGRETEFGQIVSFWRTTVNARGLRVLLLAGEAGIGKSRLVEESARQIVRSDGAVVHVRLYPDATTSLTTLLARSIWESGAGRHLLKTEPEPTVASIASALRRMCHLRPTLLVIEDIHLLAGEPLSEFASLLDVLAEEPLSILCAARPLDDSVRSVITRFLVTEVELGGLRRQGVAQVWQMLFGDTATDDMLDALHQVSSGNPLALRSALRGAVSSHAITPDRSGTQWHLTVDVQVFRDGLDRHVRLLLDGMAAHLSEEEHRAAALFAWLGEVFSHEAASVMMADVDSMIDVLSFKGVLTRSATFLSPLFGSISRQPLYAFTHTLIHRQLLAYASPGIELTVAILSANLPVHSSVPFSLISDTPAVDNVPVEQLNRAIDNTLTAADRLDATSDWVLAGPVWKAAFMLLQAARQRFAAPQYTLLLAATLHCRLNILRRDIGAPEHEQLVAEFLQITDNPATSALAEHRLHALHHGIWKMSRSAPEQLGGVLERAEVLLKSFPELAASDAYIQILQDIANVAATVGNYELGRRIETKLDELSGSGAVSDEIRSIAFQRIAPNLCWLIESEEELERRLGVLDALSLTDPDNTGIRIWQISILDQVGRLDRANEVARESYPLFQAHGLEFFCYMCRLAPITARAAFGDDRFVVEADVRKLLEEAPASVGGRLRRNIGTRLSTIGLMCGDMQLCRRAIAEYLDDHHPWNLFGLWIHSQQGDLEYVARATSSEPTAFPSAVSAIGAMLHSDTEQSRVHALQQIRTDLGEPPLRISDAIMTCVLLDLLISIESKPVFVAIADAVIDEILSGIRALLQWFATHDMIGYMRAALHRYARWIPAVEAEAWNSLIESMVARRDNAHRPQQSLEVTMLGSIQIHQPNGDQMRLRTGRLRTLLGVLVADCMTRHRLRQREFWQIVAGADGDSERARKGTNLAVHRLRTLLGHDVILTTDETPRLNTDVVQVDLLRADARLKECRQALRDNMLIRALPALESALDIMGGEVPFPGLYEGYFEAVREEIEFGIRSAIIDLAERLLGENEQKIAETVLRRGFESLPGDEEIAELLQRTLTVEGEYVEAELVRMRSSNE
jgi:hypothetical protein